MSRTAGSDYPLTMRDKKALLASGVEVRSFLVEEPAWSTSAGLGAGHAFPRSSVVFDNPFKQGIQEMVYLVNHEQGQRGSLVYLARSSSSSSSTGWDEMPFQGHYSEVVTATHPDGTVWLFALGIYDADGPQAVHGFCLTSTGWAAPSFHTEIDGRGYIYSGLGLDGGPRISASGSVPVNGSNVWEIGPALGAPGWEATAIFFGAESGSIDWVAGYDRWGRQKTYSLVHPPGSVEWKLVISYYISPGNAARVTITENVLSLAGPAMATVDGLPVMDGVFFVTNDGKSSLSVGYVLVGETAEVNTDVGWDSVSALRDDQGLVVLVGRANITGELRVARQTGTAPGPWWQYSVPTFEPYGPSSAGMTFALEKEDGQNRAAVGLSASNRLAVASWGPASIPRMLTHDLRFGWRTELLTVSAPIGLESETLVRNFVGDAYLRDAIGAPLQVAPVGLTADVPIQVQVQGQHVVLGPDATVSTWTDVFGKVTFRLPATALDVPLIHLSAVGLGQGASVNVAECVQDFLGGDAAITAVPTGLNQTSLAFAHVDGQSLIDWALAPIDADDMVVECHRAFARPPYEKPPPPPGAGEPGAVMQPERSALRQSVDATQDDLLQSFRCGALTIADLSFDEDAGSAAVWVPLTGSTVEIPLHMDAAEYTPRVLESLFWWCGAPTANLLTWMTSTIDFTQMWNTVKALEELSLSTSEWQAAAAKHFGGKIAPGVFDGALGTLTEGLEEVRSQVGERSLSQLLLPLSGSSAHGGQFPGVLGDALDLAELVDSPHGRWIFERVLYAKPGPPPPELPDETNVAPDVEAILQEFGAGELWDVYKAALPDLAAPWNTTDPSSFHVDAADMGLSLLDPLIAPALSSCEAVSTSITAAISKMNPVLTQVSASPAGAGPELVAIFAWLQLRAGVAAGDVVPLTVLRISLLTAALPINLACYRAMGAYPFPTGKAPVIPLPPDGSAPIGPMVVDPDVGGFDAWTIGCLTMQIVAATTQMIWILLNTMVDFFSVTMGGMLPYWFPTLNLQLSMYLFVGFEVFAFIGVGCPAFWGYLMRAGWALTEELGWWLQYFLQSFFILLDVVLVAFGHRMHPRWKNVILALEGLFGAVMATVYSVVLIGLGGFTFALSERAASDYLWLTNRVAVYLPGVLAPLRYLVVEYMEAQPPDNMVIVGRPLLYLKVKCYATIWANIVGAITEFAYPLFEIAHPPSLPSLNLPRGLLDKPYVQDAPFKPTGGQLPFSGWTVVAGRLPNGTRLEPRDDGVTCVLAGTPTEVGAFAFEVAVTDYFAPAQTVKQTFQVNVTATEGELV